MYNIWPIRRFGSIYNIWQINYQVKSDFWQVLKLKSFDPHKNLTGKIEVTISYYLFNECSKFKTLSSTVGMCIQISVGGLI